MPAMTEYAPGTFCWVDLATTDTVSAKTFYSGLFDWITEDLSTGQRSPYTLLKKGEKQVCALFPLSSDMGDQPRWQAYISVDDVDAMAESAVALGGSLIMPPMDVMHAGRMATILDPTGAAVCLWQPDGSPGAQLQNEPGAQCWLELQTTDQDRAERFYGELLGWTTRTSQSVLEGQYKIFVLKGEEVGGMLEIQPDWGPVPPNWSVYFGVEDCDVAVERAIRLGGKSLFPAMDIENVGRFAFLHDGQGAGFAVIQEAR